MVSAINNLCIIFKLLSTNPASPMLVLGLERCALIAVAIVIKLHRKSNSRLNALYPLDVRKNFISVVITKFEYKWMRFKLHQHHRKLQLLMLLWLLTFS